jgi:arylsulfatase A-like enzyme
VIGDHDNHAVRPPASIEDGYHLTEDLADRAIEFLSDLRAADSGKPFFLYVATGACHSPHQPPARWREHYRGRFSLGWDAWREQVFARQIASGLLPESTVLSQRPAWVPAWDSLNDREQAVAARFMECFAGFLSHTDEQVARVLSFLEDLGEADNTIVMVVSDNGARSTRAGSPTRASSTGQQARPSPAASAASSPMPSTSCRRWPSSRASNCPPRSTA